ncbi:14103_t:CDS:1, partial [Dentiscutata erythropus]
CKDYSVQKKHGSENFCPKVIGFSANTNIRFIYDFVEDEKLKPISERKINNTKLFSAFTNRLDYIVEFKKFRDDEQTPCRNECF